MLKGTHRFGCDIEEQTPEHPNRSLDPLANAKDGISKYHKVVDTMLKEKIMRAAVWEFTDVMEGLNQFCLG